MKIDNNLSRNAVNEEAVINRRRVTVIDSLLWRQLRCNYLSGGLEQVATTPPK